MRCNPSVRCTLVLVLAAFLILGVSATTSWAQTFNVPADVSTIQGAIDIANSGSTIIVAPGTYNEQVNLRDRDVTLRSSGGAAVTTINGNGNRPLEINDRNSRLTVVDGFTLTGGQSIIVGAGTNPTVRNCRFSNNQLALFVFEGAAPLLEDCVFDNNVSPGTFGPALSVAGFPRPDPLFVRCVFSNNAITGGDPRGGAVFFDSGRATFEDCSFLNNSAIFGGGAIHMRGDTPFLTLRRCLFQGNSAVEGGAIEDISFNQASMLVEDCTFVENHASGGIGGGAIKVDIGSATAQRVIRGTRFEGNTAVTSANAVEVARAPGAGLLIEDCDFVDNRPSPPNAPCCGQGGAVRIRQDSVVTIRSSQFNGNAARSGGGAVAIFDTATVAMESSDFTDNVGPNDGGAVFVSAGAAQVSVLGCTFSANQALEASAVRAFVNASGSFTVRDSLFSGNAANFATCDFRGGNFVVERCRFVGNTANGSVAVIHTIDAQSLRIDGSLFTNNLSTEGGVVYTRNVVGLATIRNTTIAHNITLNGNQAGIRVDAPLTLELRNTILWGNGNAFNTPPFPQITFGSAATVDAQFCIIQNGFAGSGNTSGDPLFADSANGDFRPLEGSPAIDSGSNAAVPGTLTTDLEGHGRILDGDANAVAVVDRGAFEAVDCNANSVPDFRDVLLGSVSDLNQNGVPDSCDDNFTVNLRTNQTFGSIADAIAAAAAGDDLLATTLQFSTPSTVSFNNKAVNLGSFGGIVQAVGGVLDLTNNARLSAATGATITVRGTMRTANNAAADVMAGSLTVDSGALLLARSGSAMNIQTGMGASFNGALRLDPGSVMTAEGAVSHTGVGTLLSGSTLITPGTFVQTSPSEITGSSASFFSGPMTLGGSVQLSNTIIISPSVTVPTSGRFTAYGEIYGDMTNSGLSTFSGQSRIFGDYVNSTSATTTIRSGTLFLFGSLTNNGTIVGTICTSCLGTPPNLDVGESLILGGAANLSLPFVGSYVRVGDDFDCAINSNARFDLSQASLEMVGSSPDQALEVMSRDIGADSQGLDRTIAGHYPIGVLHVGPGATVRLVDARDNDNIGQTACEAIYTDELRIDAGARLINPTCRIYYNTLVNAGTVDVPANVIAISTPCPGDYNGNGSVDLLDLLAFNGDWSSNLGQSVTPGTNGDYNGNGSVDLLDLLAFNGDWSSNLGQACP